MGPTWRNAETGDLASSISQYRVAGLMQAVLPTTWTLFRVHDVVRLLRRSKGASAHEGRDHWVLKFQAVHKYDPYSPDIAKGLHTVCFDLASGDSILVDSIKAVSQQSE